MVKLLTRIGQCDLDLMNKAQSILMNAVAFVGVDRVVFVETLSTRLFMALCLDNRPEASHTVTPLGPSLVLASSRDVLFQGAGEAAITSVLQAP